jgi:hypothetical protein
MGLRDTNKGVRYVEIALPFCVAGIGLCEAGADGEAVVVGFERGVSTALRALSGTNVLVRGREIALPAGIARIGLR